MGDLQVGQVAELTGQLVAIDSINPDLVPGARGEGALALFVAGWLSEAGLEVELIEPEPGRPSVVATLRGSGGGRSLMLNAHMDTVGAPVKVVHGYTLSAAEAREFARAVSRLSVAKLAATPGVAERRARTLPAAALTLDRVLKYLKPDQVVFSALGLREGFLYSQLSKPERYLDPLVEGAQLVGLPLARVPDFAPSLAAWTADLFHGETPVDTRLRVAVCALSDIAWRDHPDLRAEESFRTAAIASSCVLA